MLSAFKDKLKRIASARKAARAGGAGAFRRALGGLFARSELGNALMMRRAQLFGPKTLSRSYAVNLPSGPARITVSVPKLPMRPILEFAEHVTDADGRATDEVLAIFARGIAVSNDLGGRWRCVRIKGLAGHRVVHAKSIGQGEYLVQMAPPRPDPGRRRSIVLVVIDAQGAVLAQSRLEGSAWHGCRAVDLAHGTLMYAEYPPEDRDEGRDKRFASRVWRSRDRGRSWEVVRREDHIRHFHFLQARPGVPGEWWLTSGDDPDESRIWVTRDDGDTWNDLTQDFGASVRLGRDAYPRTLFRLTDLAWCGDTVVWGTDDTLRGTTREERGARVLSSPAGTLAPTVAGRTKWEIRNLVDLGDAYLFLTQGSVRPDPASADNGPGVHALAKTGGGLAHLFDLDVYSMIRTGFTYSRASRAAKDGTFFTFRANTDAFAFGHKMLKWVVEKQ